MDFCPGDLSITSISRGTKKKRETKIKIKKKQIERETHTQ